MADIPITEIGLKRRTINAIRNGYVGGQGRTRRIVIETVGDLEKLSLEELLMITGIGRKGINDIQDRLSVIGKVLHWKHEDRRYFSNIKEIVLNA